MSRKLLAFLLSELGTVRLICAHCKAVLEIKTEQLATRFNNEPKCGACGTSYGLSIGPENLLAQLGKAIANIQVVSKNATVPQIEFVLPDES